MASQPPTLTDPTPGGHEFSTTFACRQMQLETYDHTTPSPTSCQQTLKYQTTDYSLTT